MRYFLRLSYNGARYAGWQRQPNAPSVQATLEERLSSLLDTSVECTGCGRTDAGVHARRYVAHFDGPDNLPASFLRALNGMLPPDIAAQACATVPAGAHARHDALDRAYTYHIALEKDPFHLDTAWFATKIRNFRPEVLQATADILLGYTEFFPFCKTESGVDHYKCTLHEARWEYLSDQRRLLFHIRANRFLRGMVRLIAGACIQVDTGKMTQDDIRKALDLQQPLPKSYSVPARGLFLTDVRYAFVF